MTALLDNKARFSDYASSLGLNVPQHLVVSSPAQLRAVNNDPKVNHGKQQLRAASCRGQCLLLYVSWCQCQWLSAHADN